MKGIISIFLLPFEFEDFAGTLFSLKRNSTFIDKSVLLKIDITLCLSDEMTDWTTSKLPKEYVIERVLELCRVYLDWCEYNLYVEQSNIILGCVSHRRKSWRTYQNADFFIWLDSDIFFKDITLSSVLNSLKLIREAGYEEFILTPQIVKQWDNTWDVLVNSRFLDAKIGYQAECNIYADSIAINDQINILEIQTFKFAGGWFSILSKGLLDRVGIPDTFGHYGLDDTFIMYCCGLMKRKGFEVNQFILQNLIVGEIYKHKTNATIKNFITTKNRKDEFRKIAATNFEKELKEFDNRI